MSRPGARPSLQILLVEDSRSEALYIERTLTRNTPAIYRVRKAQTVAAAVEALEASEFDVVLLDLGLPDAKGFSGLQAIQHAAPKVPVVILTGLDDNDAELSAMENGAQDYLLKDRASVSALNRSMHHAIQRKQVENMKSEFISLVSHELRTPLTSIHGSLGLITGALSSDVPPAVSRLVQIAHRNSERLIRLVGDILDIDKIDSGQMYFDMRSETLAPILRHVVETTQAYAEKFGVRLDLEPVDPELAVEVDASRLTQVLANLVSNACKFSHSGGVVQVWVERRQAGMVRICVRDQGVGIREDFRDHIFSKFSQADSAITRKTGGAGLGLYISRQIAEHMHGRVDFESELGRGATFWVELPDPRAGAQATPPAMESHVS